MTATDFFGESPLLVRLGRTIDEEKKCCENLATVHAGKGPHGAELRCAGCGRHRGWLPQEFKTFIEDFVRRFGAPVGPMILRDTSLKIGGITMQKSPKQFDDTNRGALFNESSN